MSNIVLDNQKSPTNIRLPAKLTGKVSTTPEARNNGARPKSRGLEVGL